MKTIIILSDTHSYWDIHLSEYLEGCDEIWHAGDIGALWVADKLKTFAPLRAVHGNCDKASTRQVYPDILQFEVEGVDVVLKHFFTRGDIVDEVATTERQRTKIFVSGHTHKADIQEFPLLGEIHINPGAAGMQGQEASNTIVKITIADGVILSCKVIKLNSKQQN